MVRISLCFIIFCLSLKSCFCQMSGDALFNQRFIQSFLSSYEVNPEGRYTHEYHPILLEKTAESFDVLEQRIAKSGLDLAGRIVIFGYEENAVPCYYTNFRKPKINDEAILKKNSGWSQKLHNRFGVITGFLFKDFNELCAQNVEISEKVFEHINPQSIFVFDDRASVFQQDAFGEALDLMWQARESMTRQYEKQNIPGVLERMRTFWQLLYTNDFKVGNKQMAGTQDILFSIEYLKHLQRSPLPFIKFFTGPDITYPIELSCKQERGATLNAQDFTKILARKLQPIEDKATVYVFCSFVDGVGKSTMLGNIKNWMKHGDAYEKFDHVDNSSSQLFELFNFKENVFIADLPAQISHFSYKPDGEVFVDARTELTENQIQACVTFAQEHKDFLVQEYLDALQQVGLVIQNDGYAPQSLDASWFIRNLYLLDKVEENRWIPFVYEHESYLFHLDQPWEIRVLRSLKVVKSEGLKNISAEQMNFAEGVRFPLVYEQFLSRLTAALREKNIEKVVFVDFLSMYPRSSRENIRINYLMQQMALLKRGFDIKHSLYRDFVGEGGELLYCLLKPSLRKKFSTSLEVEALVRLALCRLIDDAQFSENLQGVSLRELTPVVSRAMDEFSRADLQLVREAVEKKLATDVLALEKSYGLSKSFVNIQRFNFSAAVAYSCILQSFLTEGLKQEKLNELWDGLGKFVSHVGSDGGVQGPLHDVMCKMDSGRSVRGLYALDCECKDRFLLAPALRLMRAQWFMVLCNLLYAHVHGAQGFVLEHEHFWVPPLLARKGVDGFVYLVQPLFEEWDQEKKVFPQVHKIFSIFNIDSSHGKFGVFDERPYLLDWNVLSTARGIYAFENDPEKAKKGSYTASIVSLLVQEYQKDCADLVMPASLLAKKLRENEWGADELEMVAAAAVRNGEFKMQGAGIIGGLRKIYLGSERNRQAAQMFVRLLVTLDMIVKDPDSDIVVRYGNRNDFKAALWLFEKVTLPRYFGMYFPNGLFDNYDNVEPYPSWNYWDSIEE